MRGKICARKNLGKWEYRAHTYIHHPRLTSKAIPCIRRIEQVCERSRRKSRSKNQLIPADCAHYNIIGLQCTASKTTLFSFFTSSVALSLFLLSFFLLRLFTWVLFTSSAPFIREFMLLLLRLEFNVADNEPE